MMEKRKKQRRRPRLQTFSKYHPRYKTMRMKTSASKPLTKPPTATTPTIKMTKPAATAAAVAAEAAVSVAVAVAAAVVVVVPKKEKNLHYYHYHYQRITKYSPHC